MKFKSKTHAIMKIIRSKEFLLTTITQKGEHQTVETTGAIPKNAESLLHYAINFKDGIDLLLSKLNVSERLRNGLRGQIFKTPITLEEAVKYVSADKTKKQVQRKNTGIQRQAIPQQAGSVLRNGIRRTGQKRGTRKVGPAGKDKP